MKNFTVFILIALVLSIGVVTYMVLTQEEPSQIGGDRDAEGCLTAAGYAYSDDVGACIREFEMTEDIKNAARMAVEEVGEGYALTVVSFNSYEEPGAYDIMLERGEERSAETVYIRGGEIIEPQTVTLYYYDDAKDRDAEGNVLCSRQGLVPVERSVVSQQPIEETIRLLIGGDLTEAERARGISTEFPLEGFNLASAELNDGDLVLTFEDPQNKTVGGSCRVGILWSQIAVTAQEFSEVETVQFMPEDLFQP